ncbi:MAG: alpha/beta hydrolase-fold protein [Anaerolineae bacterium]|nr:alpha/beta hydrolase-fold protein [Anaerolineae bacterium]
MIKGAVTALALLTLAVAACSAAPASPAPPTLVIVAATPTDVELAPQPASTGTPRAKEATPTITAAATAASSAMPTPTASPTPCTSAGEVVAGSFTSATAGGEHAYRLYLPPCYGDDGHVYPALYLFAGNIHNEGKWDELGIDEAADAAIAAGEIAPLLIVMPAGGWLADETSGGPGSYESLVLNELIPHVEATTCAWPDGAGRAIGGISRGGYWALEIAFRFPEQFASVGGHSAALLDTFAGPDVNPQQTALRNDLGDLRVYLDIGENDHVRMNTIRLHEAMAAAGITHEWHSNEGRHDDAYWSGHVPEYLEWYGETWPLDREGYPLCTE